jgi:transcriptional regulator with XRE-family HTH domain
MKNQILILDPQKLKKARGSRSLREIANASRGAFNFAQIRAYENGEYFPRPEKIPALLAALGVSWQQVSSPLQVKGLAA